MTPDLDRECCPIVAMASRIVPWTEISAIRKNPGSYNLTTPTSHIKLADEQTVLATATILQAIEQANWQDRSFQDWGIVAAPRYIGRVRFANTLERFSKQGVRGVSPLVIPHLSLHSMASTLSMAFGVHGPHFGVSGIQSNMPEALLAGITLLDEENLPGVWVVMTQWHPEPVPTDAGDTTTPAIGYGVAFALVRSATDAILELRWSSLGLSSTTQQTVRDLALHLQNPTSDTWITKLPGTGQLELRQANTMQLPIRQAG